MYFLVTRVKMDLLHRFLSKHNAIKDEKMFLKKCSPRGCSLLEPQIVFPETSHMKTGIDL